MMRLFVGKYNDDFVETMMKKRGRIKEKKTFFLIFILFQNKQKPAEKKLFLQGTCPRSYNALRETD